MLTLQEAFAQVPDPRGSRGKRYPLATFLILILLATMSGYRGYRFSPLNMNQPCQNWGTLRSLAAPQNRRVGGRMQNFERCTRDVYIQ